MAPDMLPTPGRLEEDVRVLKEWIAAQPHLPTVEDEEWLTTILYHNNNNLEKTKEKLDNYFSFRTKYPEILKNRDPTGSHRLLQTRAAYKIVFADRLTKDGELLTFGQPQPDTSIFDVESVLKMWFMLNDTVYLENDRFLHSVLIADYRHFRYTHFLKAVSWLRPMVDIFFSAYPMRLKAIHVVNAPATLDTAIKTLKGLLPKDIVDRFYVHSTTEDLCKVVDADVVCRDLGGRGPSLAKYEEYTWKRLEKHRKWFLEQNYVCSIENLRRKTPNGIA